MYRKVELQVRHFSEKYTDQRVVTGLRSDRSIIRDMAGQRASLLIAARNCANLERRNFVRKKMFKTSRSRVAVTVAGQFGHNKVVSICETS